MPNKTRATWLEAITDNEASLLWFVTKNGFLPTNRAKLQDNHNVFNESLRENADS
jgi:hypothetical protein